MENPAEELSIKEQRAREIIDEMKSRAGIFKNTLKHEEYNIHNFRTALDYLKSSIEEYADFINGFQLNDLFIGFYDLHNEYIRIINYLYDYEYTWDESRHGSAYRNDENVQRLLAMINDFDRSINVKLTSLLHENNGEHQEGGRRRRRATHKRAMRKRKSTHKKRKTHRRR